MAWFVTCQSDRASDGGLAQVISSARMPRLGANGIEQIFGPYSSFAKARQIADNWNYRVDQYLDAYVVPIALTPFDRIANWFHGIADRRMGIQGMEYDYDNGYTGSGYY